ncbi:MAG: LPXTG cell wall anchor domain-containing protein [Paludibacter sp.]|nr:LPXTG cell wall anchor domain-containing protein [Paludibacter sp.]
MKTTGTIIFILGLVLTIFTTFQFFTKEKVADLGVVEITREQPHSLSWSPFAGVAVMVVGAGLFLLKKSNK